MPTIDAQGTITHKGIYYFGTWVEADMYRRQLETDYPVARLVEYKLGWAVQYYNSGPYAPELN